jgi:hypothetical protein
VSTYGGIPDTSAERERRFQRKRRLKELTPEAQRDYDRWWLQAGMRWVSAGIISREEWNLLDPHEESISNTARMLTEEHFRKERQLEAEAARDRGSWWRRLFSKGAR